jgi:L-aminopeptidase/D-esterase-like protein
MDGDTVFAMCTGEVSATLDAVGVLASLSVENAILDAIHSAQASDIIRPRQACAFSSEATRFSINAFCLFSLGFGSQTMTL